MELAAAGVLGVTALGGMLLFALYGRIASRGGIWLPGALHGALGVAGLLLLLAGLSGPARGVTTGVASFGRVAAVLVGVAALAGAVVFVGRLRGRGPSAVVLGVHASLAVAGLVMLVAYVGAG